MTIDEAVELLEEYSSYEGSETGEMWNALTSLWQRIEYLGDEDFEKTLELKILSEAERALIDYDLKEIERTITTKRKELIYKG